jgi:hypothetical protein
VRNQKNERGSSHLLASSCRPTADRPRGGVSREYSGPRRRSPWGDPLERLPCAGTCLLLPLDSCGPATASPADDRRARATQCWGRRSDGIGNVKGASKYQGNESDQAFHVGPQSALRSPVVGRLSNSEFGLPTPDWGAGSQGGGGPNDVLHPFRLLHVDFEACNVAQRRPPKKKGPRHGAFFCLAKAAGEFQPSGFFWRMVRCFSRFQSRSFSASRLS